MGNFPGGPGPGRPKGSQNKTTALLKDAILKAAEAAGKNLKGEGDDGLQKYLQAQAIENPGPFLTLLGKVLPMQVQGDPDNPIVTEIRRVIVSQPGNPNRSGL